MLPIGEPVPLNGRTDEEEGQKELDGQNENQESDVADETEEVKTEEEEEHRENAGSENNVNHKNSEQNDSGNQESQDGENDENQEENPSGLVLVEEEDDNEEGEERIRRRTVEKGKQPMPDQGGISIAELNDDDTDYHLDLAILRTISDYKCSTPNSSHPPSFNNLLLYVKNSFPDLKISREDLEGKITALEKSFNDVRKQHGDDPQMAQPIDREIFNLSMLLWGRR